MVCRVGARTVTADSCECGSSDPTSAFGYTISGELDLLVFGVWGFTIWGFTRRSGLENKIGV